jgi:hypothetical protein
MQSSVLVTVISISTILDVDHISYGIILGSYNNKLIRDYYPLKTILS